MYLNELRSVNLQSDRWKMRHDLALTRNKNISKAKVAVPTKKKGNCLKPTLDVMVEFLQTSSIHGFQHLSTGNRHWIEYTLWFTSVILGICGSLYISANAFHRYQNDPTVICIEREYKVWNTSLPSITICPTKKIDKKAFNEFLERIPNTQERTETKKFIEQLANLNYENFKNIIDMTASIEPDDYMRILTLLHFPLKFNAQLAGTGLSTSKSTISESGICWAFNSEIAHFNNPRIFLSKEKIVPNDTIELTAGTPLTGDLVGMILDLNSGYIGKFSGTNDVPDVGSRTWTASEYSYAMFEFGALSTMCSDDVRSLSVHQRKCRFVDESNLPTSMVYSYHLCQMNCRWRLSQDLCNCAPHFYKKVEGVKTCDLNGLKCLGEHSELLINLRNKSNVKVDCKCLPTCIDRNFFIEKFDIHDWFMGTNVKFGIYRFPRIRMRRELIFGFAELMVSVGGTAGLFLGCSVLSFVEIIYFFTLRLFFYQRNSRT